VIILDILQKNNCIFVKQNGKYIYYIDNEGYYKVQRKDRLLKHSTSIIDKKLPNEYIEHNLNLLCKKLNLNFNFYLILSESKPRIIRIYYTCAICNYKGNADYNSIQQGHGCPQCANILKYSIEFVKEKFKERGYKLLATEYKNAHTKMDYICLKHSNIIQQTTWNKFEQGSGCYYCAVERRKGEGNGFWKGGLTPLYNYLRRNLKEWNIASMKASGYKCVITGEKANGNFEIHHLKSFNLILNEILNELSLPIYDNIGKYSKEQIVEIDKLNQKKHFELLGVCLKPEIHTLFHQTYGYGNNTPEQFEEFKERYKNGEFSSYLSN
jgi:hypothetical protein